MLRSIINKRGNRNKHNITIIPSKRNVKQIVDLRNDMIDTTTVKSSDHVITPENLADPPVNNDCVTIKSSVNIDNIGFIYGLCNQFNLKDNGNYTLLQFNEEIVTNMGKITAKNPSTDSPSTVIYLTKFNLNSEDGYIESQSFLWSYDSTREDYQYTQMKFLSTGDLVVLSSYTGTVTFIKNSLLGETVNINSTVDGNYFIASFNMNAEVGTIGDLLWVVPITALSNQNIEMTTDTLDNVYLVGSYQGFCRIGYIGAPSVSSSLVNDMFLAKITSGGNVVWLRTSDKTGDDPSLGSIRGESITYNVTNGAPRITAIGQYNSTFKYNNGVPTNGGSNTASGTQIELINTGNISYNLWVAQFDLDGNVMWMKSPVYTANDSTDYIDGSQIVADGIGSLYITGILKGEFTFNTEVGATEEVIYVSKITTTGSWEEYNYARVSLPKNEIYWYPHITYTDRLWISFYGFGDMYFNDRPLIKGNGNINNWINTLINGSWDCPLSLQSNIPNPCNNITISDGNDVSLIGTYIIGLNNTNAYIKKLSL